LGETTVRGSLLPTLNIRSRINTPALGVAIFGNRVVKTRTLGGAGDIIFLKLPFFYIRESISFSEKQKISSATLAVD
jgi:hypothetical protein